MIRSLPVEEQPKQIIVTRKGMLDPLEVLRSLVHFCDGNYWIGGQIDLNILKKKKQQPPKIQQRHKFEYKVRYNKWLIIAKFTVVLKDKSSLTEICIMAKVVKPWKLL